MHQPHRVTLRVRPVGEEALFVKKLAAAIVLRAIQDLLSSNTRQAVGAGSSDRTMSQEWIFGEDRLGSFQTWCNLAGWSAGAVRRRARELMESQNPEHHWRPRAPADTNLPRVALAHVASG